MSKFSIIVIAFALAAVSPAATLTINFDAANKITGDNGVLGNVDGTVSQLTLTDAGTNTVTGTLTNLFTTGTQKIDYVRLFAFDYPTGGRTVTSSDPVFDDNANKSKWGAVSDASIAYNLTVGFKNSGPNNLGPGESVVFTLTGTGLDVTDFLSSTGDVRAMLHVLSLPNGGSVKLGGEAVPEPASMAALGLGALGLLKRRKKA